MMLRPLPSLALLVLAAACAHDGPTNVREELRQLTLDEQLVLNANQHFGMDLLRELAPAGPAANLMISPLSVSLALGMTLNGAAGATFTEMRQTLRFEDIERDRINAAYQGLLEQLRLRDPKVTFTIANSIWHDRQFTVKAPFLEEAKQHFGAVVRPLDFRSASAPATINEWVSEATGGRIRDLISSIRQYDMMFLINAMYFKAPWSAPFLESATHVGAFRRDDGRVVQAQLMSQDGTFSWHTDADVQALELLYGDSAYGMLLVAPRAGTLNALVQTLSPGQLGEWLAALRPARVQLRLPRFTFRYGAELKEPLEALGMRDVFIPGTADLSGINSSYDDLHVSSVIHKTFIAVDEEGTEAAAATSVTVGVTSLPPAIDFDRPFLFFIRERASGTLLFAGIVRDPTLE